MEMKELVETYGIIGVHGNYSNSLKEVKVSELNIKNISGALKMVGLTDEYLNVSTNNLTLSERFKVDLATKLDKDIIIIGNLSKSLIYKDSEYIKKLLIKLNNEYNKKIVVIDQDITVFIGLVKYICVMKNKEIIYGTDNFYDERLYDYVRMPKIIEFVKYVNNYGNQLDKNLDIYELIKDIFRRLS